MHQMQRHKCQLLYLQHYSLQRQTLDHNPLATVFLRHLNSRASLYCFILPHKQQSHVQHTHTHTHTHTSITFTQMSWQRSSKEKWQCVLRFKEGRLEGEMESTEGGKANSCLEVAWFADIVDIPFMGTFNNVTLSWTSHQHFFKSVLLVAVWRSDLWD